MSNATRVLILHSLALLRQGLTEMLQRRDGIDVVEETDSLEAALFASRRLRPHVAVVEGSGAQSLEDCAALAAAHPHLPIVMLGHSRDLRFIVRAVSHGATLYLPADGKADDLVACLEEVRNKGRNAGPALARPRPAPPPATLVTARERQVLALVARGLGNKQIGRRLAISENTVRNHVANICGKMGVHDRTEAAVQAVKRGLV